MNTAGVGRGGKMHACTAGIGEGPHAFLTRGYKGRRGLDNECELLEIIGYGQVPVIFFVCFTRKRHYNWKREFADGTASIQSSWMGTSPTFPK